ncbi:MAG: DUF3667 domain-containing protein [Thermomonas sp.]
MTAPADPAPAAAPAPPSCRNCGVALLGPHCHACGQPVKGLMRPLGSVFGDLLDSVFDFDARILRTLRPLFTRPGFLTLEYLAGRQVRYVTPFRLFFFLAVLAFFVARLTVQVDANVNLGEGNSAIATAPTVEAVVRERDARLKQMDEAKREMAGTPGAAGIAGIEIGQQAIRDAADTRIRELQAQGASAAPPAPPAPPVPRDGGLVINGQAWDADSHPIAIGWLPGFANHWLNTQARHASDNIARLKQDPGAFKDAVLGAIPSTLFVLVPVFALLLKLAYLFQRRLYMEHLIVALHSHAFLCLSLLLILLAHVPAETFAPEGSWLNGVFDWIEGLLLLWMPVYLLLMQKRVYAQGWPMTLLKFGVLGGVYSVLLACAVTAAAMIGLVSM